MALNAGSPPLSAGTNRASWLTWFGRSALAVVEQGLISGSNFLLNVLLVRWLEPAQFGAYAVVFAIYAFLISFYQALLLEPMSVLAASLDPIVFREYLGSLLRVHGKLSGGCAVVLLAAASVISVVWHNGPLARTLAGLGAASPLILGFWLARCACYVVRLPRYAAQAAFLYTVALLSALWCLKNLFGISGVTVFLSMGAAAGAVSLVLLTRLRPIWRASSISDQQNWKEHWNFGRWELSKVGFDWISENISYTLTAGFLSLAEVGALKAIMTLFLPLTHTMAALRRLVLPYLSSLSERKGATDTIAAVWQMTILYLIGGAVYGTLVSVAAQPIFRLLYAGKFSQFTYLVPWVSVAAIFGLSAHAIDMGLRAIRSPKSIFTSSCSAALASIAITVPLTWLYGLRGAICSIVFSNSILLMILVVIFRRKRHTFKPAHDLAVETAA